MEDLIKEFVLYPEALELKELEFDEPCFAWHVSEKHGLEYGKVIQSDLLRDAVIAPTFSQCFRWFRDEYNLHTNINYDWNDEVFRVKIMKQNEDKSCNIIYLKEGEYIKEYNCYEEAELACLRKLIEIVKHNKNTILT